MRKMLSIVGLLFVVVCLGACGEAKHETPEETIALVRKAVEGGRADKLPRYIYADTPNMRKLLNRFGRLLGNLQALGVAVQEKFPKEVGELRARSEEAAKAGKSSSLLSEMMGQMGPRRGRRPPTADAGNKMRDAFNDTLKQLFADPYAWIDQSEKRLSTEFLTDNTVSVLWDGQPALAPIGMVMMRAEDSQWYFVLPTNFPGLSKVFPKTDKEYEIWGGLITVFDKMVLDLTKEVKEGKVRTIDDLSRKAGEMAFMPAMITVFAYSKLEESQKKAAKAEAAADKPGK